MVFSVDFFHPQVEWETAFIAWSFDVISAFSLSMWAVKVGFLLRRTPSRQGVLLKGMLLPWSVIVGFHLLLFDQVENAQTLLFPTFSLIFYCWLHYITMSTSDCASCSASTLFLAVVKIETLSSNIEITASSESLFARCLYRTGTVMVLILNPVANPVETVCWYWGHWKVVLRLFYHWGRSITSRWW